MKGTELSQQNLGIEDREKKEVKETLESIIFGGRVSMENEKLITL